MNLLLQALLDWVLLVGFYGGPALDNAQRTAWEACDRGAQLAVKKGCYEDADQMFQAALKFSEGIRDQGERRATSSNGLAWLRGLQGRYDEGVTLARQAVALDEKRAGVFHSTVSRDLNTLATIYLNQGKYSAAEPVFRRLLLLKESGGESETANFAAVLTNLAVVYKSQSKFREAETLCKRALAIYEKVLGADHKESVNTLNNLANIYYTQGRYLEAEPLYQRSLEVREKVYGPNHPDLALGLNNMANVLSKQGKFEECTPLYERALTIREKSLGPEHSQVASSLNNLGTVNLAEGKSAEAELLFKRALKIYEKEQTTDPSHIATTLTNLARVYLDKERFSEAETCCRRAMRLRDKKPDAIPLVAQNFDIIAEIHYAQRQVADGDRAFLRARSVHRKTDRSGTNSLSAEPANERGNHFFKQGQYYEAAYMYRHAWNLYEISKGPDHPFVAQTIENYAAALRKLHRTQIADSLVIQAKRIRERRAETPSETESK